MTQEHIFYAFLAIEVGLILTCVIAGCAAIVAQANETRVARVKVIRRGR